MKKQIKKQKRRLPAIPSWVIGWIRAQNDLPQIGRQFSEMVESLYPVFERSPSTPAYHWISDAEFKRRTELALTKDDPPRYLARILWSYLFNLIGAMESISTLRAEELLLGSLKMLDGKLYVCAATIARSYVELGARSLARSLDVVSHMRSARHASDQGDAPPLPDPSFEALLMKNFDQSYALHKGTELGDRDSVIKDLKKVDKALLERGAEGIEAIYDTLCEAAHPYGLGNRRYWGDKERTVSSEEKFFNIGFEQPANAPHIVWLLKATVSGIAWGSWAMGHSVSNYWEARDHAMAIVSKWGDGGGRFSKDFPD